MRMEEKNPSVTSRADLVFLRLEEEIVSGQLSPGEILTEVRLSEKLGVSRTPVREAIRRLEQEELVYESGKGIVVKGITADDVKDIFEMRVALEGIAAKKCALRVTSEELEEIRKTLELQEFYTGLGKADAIRNADSDFHELIYAYCGSPILGSTLSALHRKVSRYRRASVSDGTRAGDSYREHFAIYEALKAGDGKSAETLAVRHVENAAKHILSEQRLLLKEDK